MILISLAIRSAHGEELFYAHVEQIRQAAIDAALIKHPEFLPGDLADDGVGLIYVTCWTEEAPYQCQADLRFQISSTIVEAIVHKADRCYQTTTSNSVSVTVLPDGSVLRVNSSGYGSTQSSVDCPANVTDK